MPAEIFLDHLEAALPRLTRRKTRAATVTAGLLPPRLRS